MYSLCFLKFCGEWFTAHTDFISIKNRITEIKRNIKLKRQHNQVASIYIHVHMHTDTHTHTATIWIIFSYFRKWESRCSVSLGWVRQRIEKKVGMFWFAFYTIAGFSYKSRQVFQIISHSCINSLSHIFSCYSSDDKSWKSWAKFFSTVWCISCF